MSSLYTFRPRYVQNAFLQGGSKASNSFLSPCMLETVARTLFFTLPKLRQQGFSLCVWTAPKMGNNFPCQSANR